MGRGFLRHGMGTFDLARSQGHFLFQTGAIKSTDGVRLPRPPRQFQFQTGAIKRQDSPLTHYVIQCFNSKLVRLKVG